MFNQAVAKRTSGVVAAIEIVSSLKNYVFIFFNTKRCHIIMEGGNGKQEQK